MDNQPETIVKDEATADNILLTCDVQYAYPASSITWSILDSLLNTYVTLQGNSTSFTLNTNGTIEIYHHFLFKRGFVALTCSVTNRYGSIQNKFYLWEHGIFANSKCIRT